MPYLGVERVRALVGFETPQFQRAIGGHGRDALGGAGGRRVPHARIDGRTVALELDQVAGLATGEGNRYVRNEKQEHAGMHSRDKAITESRATCAIRQITNINTRLRRICTELGATLVFQTRT